jgi:ABC-type thiamin/hydroxymethylpyrimidine transport system permease subunit
LIGFETLLLAVILSVISALVYMMIGILPGTDETATMAPIALALLIAGLDPILVLAWFIASIVAMTPPRPLKGGVSNLWVLGVSPPDGD